MDDYGDTVAATYFAEYYFKPALARYYRWCFAVDHFYADLH